VVPLADEQLGHAARPHWLMFGAAGVLLLVASANVAGLLLGENRARGHETAIRLALGITRGGIVRQLVVEHVMLATAGAAAGLVLASWITRTLMVLGRPICLEPTAWASTGAWRCSRWRPGVSR
jgi:ABC-type antimicrobial peptide transport system permease subunit